MLVEQLTSIESALGDSFFGLVNFLLGDIDVSVVRPYGVTSEGSAFSVLPGPQRNISNSSSSVILTDFDAFSVFLISLGFKFKLETIVIFHFVEGPGRTDGKNIFSLMSTLVLVVIVCDQAGTIGVN